MKRSKSNVLAVLAIALLSALAVGVGPALGAPKEVAYRCDLDICLLDPDNPADVYNLTFNGATSYDQEPVWSPDGTKLAFVAQRNDVFPPTPNVFVMDPNRTDQTINVATQVTHYANGNVPLGELAWSPDGSKIAFVRGNAAPGSQLVFVAESDGSSAEPLQIAAQGGHPSWSPTGAQLAYWFSNQVYVKNSNGSGTATPLSGGVGREPIWSPDGSRIAFGHPAHPAEFLDLNIVPAAGGAPTVVTSETQFISASWSPSGSQLAYRNTSALNEGAGYVRVVNADGSGDHGLPVVQGLNFTSPAPSWSPDGSRLVFHGFYFGEAGTGDDTNKVYIANTNGTGSVTSLTGDKGYEPAWKPAAKAVPVPPLPPLPGARIKPKLIWFTKRIPWRGGYIEPMKVFCPVKDCIAKAEAKAKANAAKPRGVRPRTGSSANARSKAQTIIVARGKVKVPAGKQRPLKMKVTKKGAALIRAAGEVKLKVTVTITIKGQKKTTKSRTVRVYLAKGK